ncbi:hypothetical protein SAMN05660772_02043 [Pasteurella testudinis DSM 23072]|uniref:Uncharacterized protein n=1 Tax=Pasteurella testudinis DSM 23072 TaxID=1122938 RepID=A0A1W1UNL4_9PAST|nr:hypothetical protein [Pasteurella testudinis]SMB82304.1 hypothetical protein SAMN05660772_02043 [Pasteurella testudinis DSM 23072]SUB51481.1 Uncharacterised protein [Pasteurella testudinis]
MKDLLFNTNIATGDIILNPKYRNKLEQLVTVIITVLKVDSGTSIQLNHWSYRVSPECVAHSLEFGNNCNENTYILTLTESKYISFNEFSFISTEGEIYLYDSVDVNGIIHFFNTFLKERKIKFECIFLNRCNLQCESY